MARNISKWLRSTMTQSRFSSVAILHCHRVLIIWISWHLLMNSCQNAMLLSRAVLMKFLKIYKSSCFSALQTNIVIKCTQWYFFEQPLPAHDYDMRIKVLKRFCPLPPPLTPTNETSYWGPCTLSNVNNVQKQLPGGVL